MNGIDLGLFCSTPMVAVSRNIGTKVAIDMLMTGELISADRALAAGLVSRLATPDRLRHECDGVVEQLLARPAKVLALGKRAFYEQLPMSLPKAYSFASAVIIDNFLMEEAEEGIDAFIAKRRPRWQSA
jgi:enoyl-CoA hydratase/carnithine racemase